MYHTADHRIQLQQRPLSITLLYNDDFIPRVCLRKNIKQLPSHYRLCIGMGCWSRPSTSRLVSINAARCVISEGCYLYSVQPDSIWSCLHRVCRLRVRDCPFPPRINNKIIITKSTNTTKASFSPSYIVFFFFSPSHTRTKQGDIS